MFQVIVQEKKLDCFGKDLTKIDLNKSSNLKSWKCCHIGFATETTQKQLKRKDVVGGNDVRMLHEMIKICSTTAVLKLSQFCYYTHFKVFNLPLLYAGNKVPLMKTLKSLMQQLHILKIIDVSCVDKDFGQ